MKHRDGLNPTYPLALHYQWAVDLVAMPNGVRGAKFLVLAIEDLSSYSEGRALTSNKTEGVCRFIMEDILARYGCFDRMKADRGELKADEATEFFKKYHIVINRMPWRPYLISQVCKVRSFDEMAKLRTLRNERSFNIVSMSKICF